MENEKKEINSERNARVANEKSMLQHYMQTKSFFPPTPPIARTYNALRLCGYQIEEFTDGDIIEITEILKAKSSKSNEGCVGAMLIATGIIAGISSNGLLIPVFLVFIIWHFKRKSKN